MALNLETTTGTLPNAPAGFTPPGITITFSDDNSVKDSHSLAITGIAAATSTAGLNALISSIDTYISGTFIPNVLGLDTTGNNVDAVCTINSVARGNNSDSIFLDEATDQYAVTFSLQWEVV